MRTLYRFAQSARRTSLALCLASLIAVALALTGCGAASSSGSAQGGSYKLVENGKSLARINEFSRKLYAVCH